MKHEVFVLGQQRIDQKSKKGEARGNEEKERMRKGAIVSSSPQGITSWSSSIKIWFFYLIECIIKMLWCETECKKCAIGEQNVIN